MGIDIYARWSGQSEDEIKAQYTGFSIVHGRVGYLREAYHGEPYATEYLVREAFESKDGTARVPSKTLRERLPRTLELVRERERVVYHEEDEDEIRKVMKSFTAFVELCERKERETGAPVTIVASY